MATQQQYPPSSTGGGGYDEMGNAIYVQQQPPPDGLNQYSQSPWSNLPPPPAPGQADIGSGTSYGGQQTVGAQAGAADYAGVQDFADASYENARRYLDPQQDADRRRFSQTLINRGIDPNTEQGREAMSQMMRGHGDQDQGAAFGAMQFGQGIQEQMFRQNFDNTRQAGNMQQAKWNADLTRSGQDLSRYGMDQQYGLGMGNLELGRQQQDFGEIVGYGNMDFRNAQFNEGNQRWDEQLAMTMAGQPMPVGGGFDANAVSNPWTGGSNFFGGG